MKWHTAPRKKTIIFMRRLKIAYRKKIEVDLLPLRAKDFFS
jgi:hypothetical protein